MPRPKAKAKKNTSEGEASQEYNWNVKSRLLDVLHEERSSAAQGDETIEWGDDALPEDGEPLAAAKVNKFNLNHGDILRFNDYRFSQSYFVHRTPGGKYRLVENPDDSGSAHLTIPAEVLHNVTDALAKYSDILKVSSSTIHLSNEDKFVRNQLGEAVPQDWNVVLGYNFGKRENVCVTQGNNTWETTEWELASVEEIKNFFCGAEEPSAQLVVKIDLKGDKFKEYKAKHSMKKKGLAWVTAFPKLPKTWSAEKGTTGMGSSHYRTEWKCKGPSCNKDEVKSSIETFFDGFEVGVEDQAA